MFITFAGTEGSGKSTVCKALNDFLIKNGYETVLTREPGGTDIGKKIREILLDPENKDLSPRAEMLLYAADRSQHIETVILPSIGSGKIVISDRFHDCTVAYQGFGRKIDMSIINQSVNIALNGFKPDLTIWLNLDVQTGLNRAMKGYSEGDRDMSESRFDMEYQEFHERVREGYLFCAIKDPDRFVIIDASKSLDETIFEVNSIVLEKIKNTHQFFASQTA